MGKTLILCWPLIALCGFGVGPVQGEPQAAPGAGLRLLQPGTNPGALVLDPAVLPALSETGPRYIATFPVLGVQSGAWLERFSPVTPQTQFVIGSKTGPDRPFHPDLSGVVFLRGRLEAIPDAHLMLAVSPEGLSGRLTLAGAAHRIIPRGITSAGYEAAIAPAEEGSIRGPGVAWCGVSDPPPAAARSAAGQTQPRRGLLAVEVAVETDYEYYELFGDAKSAAAYLVHLYAVISDIYIRDVNTRVQLSFVRLWDTPDDLFNQEDPLAEFRNFWNFNMAVVPRDVAMFLSGRRNFPYGGVAYVSSLCGPSGYSVVGYLLGGFRQAELPAVDNYDIAVTAHELGHNCGTFHTHDGYTPPIDRCDLLEVGARRGTLMSYCGQTVSGSNACIDLRFHSRVQVRIEIFLLSRPCVSADCNLNNNPDETDIGLGLSIDSDLNGIPDECEDCNVNGVLDGNDIAAGTSSDLDGNGIPDDCDMDCNANSIPDALELPFGQDLYGNNILDECEADCDADGVSDYNQILADMTLDVNRDAILDSCQDCDGDGVVDRVDRQAAHDVWVTSRTAVSHLTRFHGETGVVTALSDEGHVNQAADVVIGPGDHLFVASRGDGRIVEFELDGTHLGDFVPAGSGGLNEPVALLFTPDGRLLVSSHATDSILEYDGASGAFIRTLVASGSGGLNGPVGLVLTPTGELVVASHLNNRVLRYDASTGASLGTLVAAGSGGLSLPTGLVYKSDGNLLVADSANWRINEYRGGDGAFVRQFSRNGTPTALTMDLPWALRIGPNGNVFASRTVEQSTAAGAPGGGAGGTAPLHVNSTRLFEFDVRNGNFLNSFITGNDTGLYEPGGFAFVPGWSVDCNLNHVPDNCDIAARRSLDGNADGIPDECQVDCNGNGVQDRRDIIPFGSSFDCDFNGVPDECETIDLDCNGNGVRDTCELASGAATDCNGNGQPDDCDFAGDCNGNCIEDAVDIADCAGMPSCADCNTNGVPDGCELASDPDCNQNLIPDECEPGGSTDCDGDGQSDLCAVLSGASVDCNDNFTPDACELAGGSPDCDADGILDECQIDGAFARLSPPLLPLHSGTVLSFTIVNPPAPTGPVQLDFTAIGDLSSPTELINVDLNGVLIGSVFAIGAQECPLQPDHAALSVPAAVFTDIVGPDDAVFGMTPSSTVSAQSCLSSYLQVAVSYTVEAATDCNQNGVPDGCDIASGQAEDLDANDLPDSCQPRLVHAAAGASPRSGFIDPRAESSNGADLDLGITEVRLVYSEPVFSPAGGAVHAGNLNITQTGSDPAPEILEVSAAANPVIVITFDRPITPQEWTTVQGVVVSADGWPVLSTGGGQGADEPDRLDIAMLPGDIDQSGQVSPVDFLRFRQYLSGQYQPPMGAPEDYFDTDRDGTINGLDVLRYRQLLFGTGLATRPWALAAMNHPRP